MSSVHPVYLVKGDDPTLVNQAVSKLVDELVGERSVDFTVQEVPEEADMGALLDAAQTPAFLTDRRVVVVRSIGRFRADEVDPLITYLSSPVDSTSIVMVNGGGAIPQRLNKVIKDKGQVVDVSVPTGKARQGWMKDQLNAAPVRLDRNAQQLLTDHLGDEVGTLAGLFDALASAYGPGSAVDAQQLEPFLGSGGSATPWQLTDAIDSGDTAGAILALRRMLDAGQRHPLVVMATLSRHVGSLLRLDGGEVTTESEAARVLGMAPFPAKKALGQARRLGSPNIFRAVELVAQAELDLKGASAWPGEMVLEVLVARLSRLTPAATNRGRARVRSNA